MYDGDDGNEDDQQEETPKWPMKSEVCQAIKTLICCGGNQDAMANKPVVIHNRQKY